MIPVYTRRQLESALRPAEVIRVVEEGFASFSRGKVVVPPVGELLFENPPGNCHIKYGYIRGDDTFTVKVATGFPENVAKRLPSSNGIILVFSSQTGHLRAILQDEGFLTDIRTAAAGAVAAKLLAPSKVERIGIIGAGTQGKLQLEYLKEIVPTRRAMLWSRSRDHATAYRVDGFEVQIARCIRELADECRLIVTTTSSSSWLLASADVQPGTHITAVGADSTTKQELEPELFALADVRVVDSRKQCTQFGDAAHAVRKGLIQPDDLVELGELIDRKKVGRQHDSQVTIADLTGVAIQDIEIAKLALKSLASAADVVTERTVGQ